MPHRRRPPLRGPLVAHVTVRLLPHVYQLRSVRCWKVLERAFLKASDRHGMRLCHYSVQRDHFHLIVEAEHRDALSRGMLGLGIRVARGLNGCMGLRGRVLADRYHAHVLTTPLEVRRALLYVLNNVRKHLPQTASLPRDWVDPYSTAVCFDGWRQAVSVPRWGPGSRPDGLPRAAPKLWLLRTGWRRGGRLDPGALPGPRRDRQVLRDGRDGTAPLVPARAERFVALPGRRGIEGSGGVLRDERVGRRACSCGRPALPGSKRRGRTEGMGAVIGRGSAPCTLG